jgi:hypothetical protein
VYPFAKSTLSPSNLRKNAVEKPTIIPTTEARKTHLLILINRTELSRTLFLIYEISYWPPDKT